MLALNKKACSVGLVSLVVLGWVFSCATTSGGIDLAVRGGLEMEVLEDGDTGSARVTARIMQTLGGPNVVLTSDQTLSINGSGLTVNSFTGEYSATIEAADQYEIRFGDKGVTESMLVRQETALDDFTPTETAGELTIEWTPSGSDDVAVGVLIDSHLRTTVADSGSTSLSLADYDDVDPGEHTLAVRRYRTETASPAFGGLLASAEVSVGSQLDASMTIVNTP